MTERPMPSNTICLETCSIHAPVRMAFIAPLRHLLHNLRLILGSRRALGARWCTNTEAVAELAGDGLEVSHASGTGGLPSLGLLAPVDCSLSVLVQLLSRCFAWVSRTLAGLSSRVAA